jgi:flagellar biosynthetic protein FliR
MNLLGLSVDQFLCFFLILGRVSGLFLLAPVLGSKEMPRQVKLGLALMISMILLPVVRHPAAAIPTDFLPFTLLLGKEILAGLVIGYASTLVFLGVMVAGQIIDFQMGFSIVSLIDPITNLRISVVGQLKYLISLLIFLAINGHHLLLSALAKSFEVSPLSTFSITPRTTDNMIRLFCNLFVIALKIGLPAIGVLLMTSVVLGILARTVPQMNVFIVGMPLKIGIGFATIILILPFLVVYLEQLFNALPNELIKLFV